MASILRTGKFIRYFAGFSRNIVLNSVRDTDSGGNLLQSTPCMCSQFQISNFASNAAPKTDLSLEKQLRRMDQDVRRIGRISRRDIEDVLEEIRTQRSATSSQSLLVIRCCGNLVPEEMPATRTALVQEIWRTLNALNVPMDVSHYNALLRVYLENEHAFTPTDFLAELETKSIEPNRVTYQRLIQRYCQLGDINGATRILEFMREKNLPVNENVFNSLILGHAQASDMESARGILAVMKQAGLEPSADTYTTLLCGYARHGDIDAILKTLEECVQLDVLLLDKDLLDVIYQLAVNGHAAKVDAVLGKMQLSSAFNQDAVNVILGLVNGGQDDVALKILRLMPRSTRADGQLIDAGTFFVRQLVKVNRPVEQILSVCKTLQDEGLNSKALLLATEAGLSQGMVNNTLPLLKEMKNAGLPIRQHYFWPLFCAAKSGQVMDIVRRMQEDFALHPNSETVREYIIPQLGEKNWDRIVTILRDAGISNATASCSAAFAALSANQMREAATIMEAHRAFFPVVLFRQPLIQALNKTNNYDAFVRILRQLHESALFRQSGARAPDQAQETEELADGVGVASTAIAEGSSGNGEGVPDVVGMLLSDVCSYFRSDCIPVLENLLPLLVAQGLSISNGYATRISERLGSDMSTSISEQLGRLSSGEQQLVPLKNADAHKRTLDELSVEELERFISNVEAKGDKANNLKRSLLNACLRSKNVAKTLQVIEKLEEEQFVVPTGIWAQLIDMHAQHGQLSEALALFEKLRVKEPDFAIDNMKSVRIADMLLREERMDEAIAFLDKNKKAHPFADGDGSYNYVSLVWRMLNHLADAGNAQQLQRIFDMLVESHYVVPNNVVLGPLIKVHLVRDDVTAAIETFERICQQYKATPWKNELACRLIQREDAASLQKLTDLSTAIHGEVNSLYDLVFSFVECGRIRQARKILETPGLRTRPQRLDNACERYKNEGMVESLEGLIEATKDLNHIDRNKIFYNLLLSYCKTEDADKALGLWTMMQEEALVPNDDFLNTLAELLQKKGMDVPFVTPQTAQPKRIDDAAKTKRVAGNSDAAVMAATSETTTAKKTRVGSEGKAKQAEQAPSKLTLFRKAVNAGNTDEAIVLKSELKKNERSSVINMSHLIEQLVRADRLNEATKYVEELLAEQYHPMPKIFKFYLNKIAAAGDIETLERMSVQISDDLKKVVSFDNRVCNAFLCAGKLEQYMQRLENDIDAAKTPEDAAKLAEKFPRGGALGILEKHPETLPQYQKIAEKYAAQNQPGPINVLWIYLISNGKEQESRTIWDKYLSNAPRLMFQRVLQTAREQKDEQLAANVINQLRESKISEGAIGNAYSCLIDIHTTNENVDKALDTLKTAIKDISLENINRTALQRLKSAVVAQNKEFPYTIPDLKAKNASSSSSSSDDDVKPIRPETRPPKPQLSTT